LADARGDVFRGLEVVELTCGTASLMMGETMEGLANGKGGREGARGGGRE
jgi:malonate-semialdehyde dehydrogenase (acetylating)/methylmalonate-semialdehyde dehydrogenase